MALPRHPPTELRSGFLRYGLAVGSVSIAFGVAFLLQHYDFREVEFPLFWLAVAVTAWFAGPGPGAVALILSAALFNYFFTEPLYTLLVKTSDLPRYVIFLAFSTLIAWFSAIRQRAESELRRARDELQVEVVVRTQQASLLNLTHDTIFVRDMAGTITYWNRGAEELYGWTAEQAVGKPAQQLLKAVYPAALEQIRAELLGEGRWEGELRTTKADGTNVIVASRWSLQKDDRGLPVAILETNNDITERKRREEENRQLNVELAKRSLELEGTNKELEAFAYSVSHDLRAPLRHMSGFTELLQKRAAATWDDRSQRYMQMILESAKRMGNLIDDLLAFSRIGRAETRKTVVSLDQIVKEAMSEIRQDAAGRNIVWTIGALPDLYVDRAMLKLALVNLISNAIKFTRTREPARIEIGCADGHHNETVVFVKDNGVGFDMTYVNKLFGVFQRLHQTETFEGTGIGLATVQRIVHRHGGRAWAEGVVDGGATFYFSIDKSRQG